MLVPGDIPHLVGGLVGYHRCRKAFLDNHTMVSRHRDLDLVSLGRVLCTTVTKSQDLSSRDCGLVGRLVVSGAFGVVGCMTCQVA